MMATQNGKVSPVMVAESQTDIRIAQMAGRVDNLHAQLQCLSDKLGMVLSEEMPRPCPPSEATQANCLLHYRLDALAEQLEGVSQHLENISSRVEL